MIDEGLIVPGTFLPSSRSLSSQYGIGRNTVVLAYERLLSEGLLETVKGRGTRVCDRLPFLPSEHPARKLSRTRAGKPKRQVAEIWREIDFTLPETSTDDSLIDFAPGKLSPQNFPYRVVEKFGKRALYRSRLPLSRYGEMQGLEALRISIAKHLSVNRGMKVDANNIVITAGTQEALNIVARLLLTPRSTVAVEDPCYQGAALTFKTYGARLAPIKVDQGGIDAAALSGIRASIVYLTPSHQFPTGGTLDLYRRHKVIEWARSTGAYIVEDDYDSDYRYDSPPLVSMAGADDSDSVIYIGTVSKSLGPGFRIGYLVVPSAMSDAACRVKATMSLGSNFLEQDIVEQFFHTGEYDRQLRRIRKLYIATRDTIVERLAAQFSNLSLEIWGVDAGMHFMWLLPPGFPEAKLVTASALRHKVRAHTIESAGAVNFDDSELAPRAMILGYSSMTPQQAVFAVDRIADVIRSLRRGGQP